MPDETKYSGILDRIQQDDWEGAMELFSGRLDEGSISEEESILGATILEHFGEWDSMYDVITYGLELNPHNYELYVLLGNYYKDKNADQAFLSYENALFLAEKQNAIEDSKLIENIIEEFRNENKVSARNVSFVILSFNTKEYTELCIDSIRRTCKKGCYEIVVVDNASSDGSVEWLREQADVTLIANDNNVGFPAGCNQGVRHANPDNDIFLLNNDTLMMDNSLYLLRMGLYESQSVGAVGAVTNYASNNQKLTEKGKSIEECYSIAYRNNVPKRNCYEKKSMLIMFATLIKRNVWNVVGELDERFTPGNYEDNDYGIRIILAGFDNILCWNSFIYHYGSKSFSKNSEKYHDTLAENKAKYTQKWGFYPNYYSFARTEIVDMINDPKDAPISVLEVGCGFGDTLCNIKYKYPNSDVYGIELVEKVAEIGAKKIDIRCGNAEKLDMIFEEKFDYIVFGDVLEHLVNPDEMIRKVRECLKDNGCIIASIPNLMNAQVIYNLLHGDFTYQDSGILDRTHLRFFTKNEIFRMFGNAGYEIEMMNGTVSKNGRTETYKEFFDTILDLVGRDKKPLFDVYQYVVRARKVEN